MSRQSVVQYWQTKIDDYLQCISCLIRFWYGFIIFLPRKFCERVFLKRGVLILEMLGTVVWMCRVKGLNDHGKYKIVTYFE